MGLDWNPVHKPKTGNEAEYQELFDKLTGKAPIKPNLWNLFSFNRVKETERLKERFFDISISAFETLGAPQVGVDKAADEWARGRFEDRTDKNATMEQFMEQMQGFYVVDLVPEHEGIPIYVAMHDERFVFRAAFLHDCEKVIGKQMLDAAHTTMSPEMAIDYGEELMRVADAFAAENGCEAMKDQRTGPKGTEDSTADKAHILFSAAKWLLWWAKRGHPIEARY